MRRAAGRAAQVIVLAYGGRAADLWWMKEGPALARLDNLTVLAVEPAQSLGLVDIAERGMRLNCTLQEEQNMFGSGSDTVVVEPRRMGRADQDGRG